MPCLQVYLMFGVAVLNSIAAYIQKWPTAYQIINIPHFLMYIAIIYYLCKKEFYTVAWAVFALITLVVVDFMILSKKIFGMEEVLMNRIRGSAPSTPCGCAKSCGCSSPSIPQQPTTLKPHPSQPLSQFTSQPSSPYALEQRQEIGSSLEAGGYKQPKLNVYMNPSPIMSDTVKVKY